MIPQINENEERVYDARGKSHLFSKMPESRSRIDGAMKPKQIKGITFVDTPENMEPEHNRDELRRLIRPASITVGQWETTVKLMGKLQDDLFVTKCVASGAFALVVILLMDRFL